ncbi:MAG: hypothetical protein AAFY35_08775 [Pseudomonadota bacterium]
MGSVRRGLILSLVPGPAFAEACDTIRPGWDGGEVSAVAEAITLFSSPIALILLFLTALVFRFRSSRGALALCLFWSFLITAVTFFDPTGGVRTQALAEGCVGSPWLFIAIVGALSVGMILYTGKPETKGPSPQD